MTFEGCNINPKLLEIQKILLDEIGRDENGRGIIFVRTRLLAMYLIKWMKSTDALSDLKPTTFVGQNAPSDLGGKKDFKVTSVPGRVAQSVTCQATDVCLTADPGVASLIPVWSHTFVEIDHEIICMVILLPSADLFKKGCCQLQEKVCSQITG